MSVRAYKIITLETEDSSTFNLWRDDFIVDNVGYTGDLDDGGSGIIEVWEGDVKQAIKNFEEYWDEYNGEDKTPEDKKNYKAILRKMLKDTKDSGGYAQYQCF